MGGVREDKVSMSKSLKMDEKITFQGLFSRILKIKRLLREIHHVSNSFQNFLWLTNENSAKIDHLLLLISDLKQY